MATKTWMGWGLAIAGVLAAAPLVLGRGNPALSNARDTVSQMSDVDRAVLNRKYSQYRALTEQERSEMRRLHAQLEVDRIKGPRSLETMAVFCDWIKTIDAWQQDELEHLNDPEKKLERVASIVKDRTERSAAKDQLEGDRPPSGGTFRPARLTEEQLTKVFDVLAKRVTITPEEQAQIDQLHGLKRFGVQIRHIHEKSDQNRDRLFRSITEAELREFTEASGNSDLKALLASSGEFDAHRKLAILGVLRSCRTLSIRESTRATEEELRTYFKTLPEEEQDQLLQLSANQFKHELQIGHLESDPDIAELKTQLDKEFNIAKRKWEQRRVGLGPKGPRGAISDPARDGDRNGPPQAIRDQFGKQFRFRPGDENRPPPGRPEEERRPPPP